MRVAQWLPYSQFEKHSYVDYFRFIPGGYDCFAMFGVMFHPFDLGF